MCTRVCCAHGVFFSRAGLLYVVRLADRCGVDLDAAVLAKLAQNRAKYPADKCKGSSAKYTAYVTQPAEGEGEAGGADAAAAAGDDAAKER
jgi:dCTP diphosphatase